jgi:hypothetical protein
MVNIHKPYLRSRLSVFLLFDIGRTRERSWPIAFSSLLLVVLMERMKVLIKELDELGR